MSEKLDQIKRARLRSIRLKKRLLQEKLARLANIALNTLTKIESGLSIEPTIKTIAKIADALGVSIDELLGRDKNNIKRKQ